MIQMYLHLFWLQWAKQTRQNKKPVQNNQSQA